MNQLICIAAIVAATACSPAMHDHHTNRSLANLRQRELQTAAAARLDCQKDRIDYHYQGEKVHILSGCGRKVRYLIFDHHNTWVKIESFHPVAASELDCSEDRLEATYLRNSRWGVSGCGRQATYTLSCRPTDESCKWVAVM